MNNNEYHQYDYLIDNILNITDNYGMLIHNKYQGYVVNKRMQRAAGLSIIELNQMLENNQIKYNWIKAMNIIVKWRQLAEPSDQVNIIIHSKL